MKSNFFLISGKTFIYTDLIRISKPTLILLQINKFVVIVKLASQSKF